MVSLGRQACSSPDRALGRDGGVGGLGQDGRVGEALHAPDHEGGGCGLGVRSSSLSRTYVGRAQVASPTSTR